MECGAFTLHRQLGIVASTAHPSCVEGWSVFLLATGPPKRYYGGRKITTAQLSALLVELLSLPHQTEWVERKHNNDNPEMIAERISALANSAALHGRDFGYIVWGVEDGTKKVVGTSFRPRQSKKGNEELENWLMRSQHPQVNFQMHEWSHQGLPMVLLRLRHRSDSVAYLRPF